MTHPLTKTFVFLFAGLGLVACASTNSQNDTMPVQKVDAPKAVQTQTQKTAQADGEDADDPMICENVAVTGQIRPKRVCIRKSVRDARRQDARNSLDGIQRGALSSCIPNAGGACGG